MTGRALLAAALLALSGGGVKAPPRPPAGAAQAPGAQVGAAQGSEPGTGADAAPGKDCGPTAATGQENAR